MQAVEYNKDLQLMKHQHEKKVLDLERKFGLEKVTLYNKSKEITFNEAEYLVLIISLDVI